MVKQKRLLLQKDRIARIVCVLLFVFCLTCLSGCSLVSGGSQGNEAVNAEKETMSCWTCSLFELAFRVIDSMSVNLMASIADSSVSLLGVCYALWLAIYILKYVSAMNAPDTGAFWKGLAVQTFFVTLGAGMLRDLGSGSSSSVIEMITDPIFTGFVDTGLMIINASGLSFSCPSQGSPEAGMVCLISALQGKLNVSVGISYLSIVAGPTIFVIMVGAGIYCVSIFMMLYFPVLLLDCVFRYCILIALLPLIVVAFCFKITRGFAKQGGQIMVEIGLAIVGMCVFTAVTVEVIHQYIDEFIPYVRNPLYFLDDPSSMDKVMNGPGITGLIFVILFLIYFADVILDLMGMFSEGAGGLGKTAQSTYSGVKNLSKTGMQAARFGINRGMRIKDKKAIKDREKLMKKQGSGKELTDKEKKKLEKANDRLSDRGFLATDRKGNLHKTQAYDNLNKGKGLRNWAKGIGEDWHSNPMRSSLDRRDHSANKVSDGFKGYLDD